MTTKTTQSGDFSIDTMAASKLLALHMFFVGLQAMSVIFNCRDGNPFMVGFSAAMAGLSGFCAYGFYCKLAEHPESAN